MTQTVATATATWYAVSGGNDLYWRAEAPAKAVGGRACLIPEVGGVLAITQPNADTAFPWYIRVTLEDTGEVREFRDHEEWHEWTFDHPRVTGYEIVYPEHEGAAVWVRPDGPREKHSRLMREKGFRQIAEVDDNYVSNPKLNLFQRANNWTDKETDHHLRALALHDAVVFSTGWLRDRYHREFRKRFGRDALPEMYVCGNHVDEADWPERIERDGPVRVGWMGSPSHIWDVKLAYPAFAHARDIGCETWMIGLNPANPLDNIRPEDISKKVAEGFAAWERICYRHVPWRQPEQYERIRLPLDIGLCPLLTNEFTLGKSDVKWLEYTIAGAATVAWNNPVYNRTIKHGETGLLVGSPLEMAQAVDMLARDENLRARLVENAQQYVREERGLKQLRAEWLAAIGG